MSGSPARQRDRFDEPTLDPLGQRVVSLGVTPEAHVIRPVVRRGGVNDFGLGVTTFA